jgi:RNA recognition motif-containing protein
MNGKIMFDRQIRVSLATPRQRPQQFTTINNMNDPNCTTIFVGGLPNHITELDLVE